MRLLNYDDKKLTPEARWLLLQWSWQTGLDKPLTLPLRDLRGRFEMPLLRLRQALACLIKLRMIAAETYQCSHKKGRPRTHFTITDKLHHLLATTSVSDETSHQGAIEHVVAASSVPPMPGHDGHPNLLSGDARNQHMLVATRWLLIVLLAHADVTGSLSHLSYSDLQRLTGLSRVRLRSQLRKLSDMGVLADYQGGRLGKVLGIKRTSIIVLDLTHLALGGANNAGVDITLIKSDTIPTSSTEHDMIKALFVAAICENEHQKTALPDPNGTPKIVQEQEAAMARPKANNRQKMLYDDARALLPPQKYIEPMAAILAGHYSEAGARWLQAYVQHYALRLLNEAWVPISKDMGMLKHPVAEILQAIEQDCQETTLTTTDAAGKADHDVIAQEDNTANEEDEPLHADKGTPSPLAMLLYALAHHLACSFKNCILMGASGIDIHTLHDARFSLPTVERHDPSLLVLRCFFLGKNPIKSSCRIVNTVWTPFNVWLQKHNTSLEESFTKLILSMVIQRVWLFRSQLTTPKPVAER